MNSGEFEAPFQHSKHTVVDYKHVQPPLSNSTMSAKGKKGIEFFNKLNTNSSETQPTNNFYSSQNSKPKLMSRKNQQSFDHQQTTESGQSNLQSHPSQPLLLKQDSQVEKAPTHSKMLSHDFAVNHETSLFQDHDQDSKASPSFRQIISTEQLYGKPPSGKELTRNHSKCDYDQTPGVSSKIPSYPSLTRSFQQFERNVTGQTPKSKESSRLKKRPMSRKQKQDVFQQEDFVVMQHIIKQAKKQSKRRQSLNTKLESTNCSVESYDLPRSKSGPKKYVPLRNKSSLSLYSQSRSQSRLSNNSNLLSKMRKSSTTQNSQKRLNSAKLSQKSQSSKRGASHETQVTHTDISLRSKSKKTANISQQDLIYAYNKTMRKCGYDCLTETRYYNMLAKLQKQVLSDGISYTKALDKQFKLHFFKRRAAQLNKTIVQRKFFIKWLESYLTQMQQKKSGTFFSSYFGTVNGTVVGTVQQTVDHQHQAVKNQVLSPDYTDEPRVLSGNNRSFEKSAKQSSDPTTQVETARDQNIEIQDNTSRLGFYQDNQPALLQKQKDDRAVKYRSSSQILPPTSMISQQSSTDINICDKKLQDVRTPISEHQDQFSFLGSGVQSKRSQVSTARKQAFKKEVIKQISVLTIKDALFKHLQTEEAPLIEYSQPFKSSLADLKRNINKHSGETSKSNIYIQNNQNREVQQFQDQDPISKLERLIKLKHLQVAFHRWLNVYKIEKELKILRCQKMAEKCLIAFDFYRKVLKQKGLIGLKNAVEKKHVMQMNLIQFLEKRKQGIKQACFNYWINQLDLLQDHNRKLHLASSFYKQSKLLKVFTALRYHQLERLQLKERYLKYPVLRACEILSGTLVNNPLKDHVIKAKIFAAMKQEYLQIRDFKAQMVYSKLVPILRFWSGYTKQKKSQEKQIETFRCQTVCSHFQKVLQIWSKLAQKRKAMRSNLQIFTEKKEVKTKVLFFRLLKLGSLKIKQAREMEDAATSFYYKSLQRKCLRSLNQYQKDKVTKSRIQLQVQNYIQSNKLARVFFAFQQVIHKQKDLKQKQRFFELSIHNQRTKVLMFSEWLQLITTNHTLAKFQNRQLKSKWFKHLKKAVRASKAKKIKNMTADKLREQQLLRKMLFFLARFSKKQITQKNLITEHLIKREVSLKSKCFQSLAEYTRSRQNRAQSLHIATNISFLKSKRTVFLILLKNMIYQQNKRKADHIYRLKLKHQHLKLLKNGCDKQRILTHHLLAFGGARYQSLCIGIFQCWHSLALFKQARRLSLHQRIVFFKKVKAIKVMKQYTCKSQMNRDKVLEMTNKIKQNTKINVFKALLDNVTSIDTFNRKKQQKHLNQRLLTKGFKALFKFRSMQKKGTQIANQKKTKLIQTSLKTWQNTFKLKQTYTKLNSSTLLRLEAKTFTSFKLYYLNSLKKHLNLQKSDSHYSQRLLTISFSKLKLNVSINHHQSLLEHQQRHKAQMFYLARLMHHWLEYTKHQQSINALSSFISKKQASRVSRLYFNQMLYTYTMRKKLRLFLAFQREQLLKTTFSALKNRFRYKQTQNRLLTISQGIKRQRTLQSCFQALKQVRKESIKATTLDQLSQVFRTKSLLLTHFWKMKEFVKQQKMLRANSRRVRIKLNKHRKRKFFKLMILKYQESATRKMQSCQEMFQHPKAMVQRYDPYMAQSNSAKSSLTQQDKIDLFQQRLNNVLERRSTMSLRNKKEPKQSRNVVTNHQSVNPELYASAPVVKKQDQLINIEDDEVVMGRDSELFIRYDENTSYNSASAFTDMTATKEELKPQNVSKPPLFRKSVKMESSQKIDHRPALAQMFSPAARSHQ